MILAEVLAFPPVLTLGRYGGVWLVFSLLNAIMEEIWFRGLFLKRLAPFLGQGLSILLVALVFSASHLGANHVTPGDNLLFLTPTFVLGLGAGYLIMRADSVWGGVPVHAGADVFYALGFGFQASG